MTHEDAAALTAEPDRRGHHGIRIGSGHAARGSLPETEVARMSNRRELDRVDLRGGPASYGTNVEVARAIAPREERYA